MNPEEIKREKQKFIEEEKVYSKHLEDTDSDLQASVLRGLHENTLRAGLGKFKLMKEKYGK